jgi:general stress protein YciG
MDNLQNTEATVENISPESKPRSRRGFASMDPNRVRELARLGGQSAHRHGRAHEFTSDEARLAGRKGGLASHRSRKEGDETTSG